MNDCIRKTIPRNSMGWPVIGPEVMTYDQLIYEASKCGNNHFPGTVAFEERDKYAKELLRRGFSTNIEYQEKILPHEVPGRAAEERHLKWQQGQWAGR